MAAYVNGWAHAVPLDETNGFEQPQRTGTLQSEDSRYSGARELSSRRTSEANIMSDSETAGSRRASIRAVNASAGRKRSRNTLKEKRLEMPEEPVDDSAWIHRDKLAQIEIQEMEDAGIHVRSSSRRSLSAGPGASVRSSRSASRSAARRPVSKDRQDSGGDDHYGTAHSSYDDYERKRVSTIPAADEDEHDFNPNMDTELRAPEEIAAEQQHHRQHMIRPSTSRIPISKASPVPVPQTVVDRDSPLPRSRHGSGAFSGSWEEMQYARRARGNSYGSQALLDDGDGVKTPPRPSSSYMQEENSPPKSRLPGKATPTAGARTASAATSNVNRPPSAQGMDGRTGSNAHKRPMSSSGHKSRPSTSHAAPVGDAPWIASMYKPDPRLPPDQQMLPTHAKRMQQEQWEKEGKTGTAYDRDFKLLNDEEFHKPKAPLLNLSQSRLDSQQHSAYLSPARSPERDRNSPGSESGNAWPLSPNKSDTKSDAGSVRPGTSGGYKITPTIPSPPPVQRPPTSQQSSYTAPPAINPTPRVPDLDEKQQAEPKKGCCCIVM